MKAITEFPNFTLDKGLKAKASLMAEGKTPEEIQASLGETFKLEGDKLKYFINAIDVAEKNPKDLKRVIVMSFNEGESAPSKAVKVDEMHYVPDFIVLAKPAEKSAPRGRGGPRKGGGDKKGSPWGMTPEEKAAKNKGGGGNKPA